MIRLLLKRGGFFSVPSRIGFSSIGLSLFLGTVVAPTLSQNFDIKPNSIPKFEANAFTISAQVLADIPASRRKTDEYAVKSGDTLFSIGQAFSVSVDGLAYINNLSAASTLKPGQVLKIPPLEGLVHTVKSGETVSAIAQKYEVDPQAIVDFNYLEAPYALSIGQALVVPDGRVPEAAATQARGGLQLASNPNVLNKTGFISKNQSPQGFIMPTDGTISQYFSWGHPAIDIANSASPNIWAADGGSVVFAGWWPGGGGNSVWVDHGNGFISRYAHLQRIYVSAGQKVNKGQALGQMGQSGRAYGVHLHFVIDRNGVSINPLSVL